MTSGFEKDIFTRIVRVVSRGSRGDDAWWVGGGNGSRGADACLVGGKEGGLVLVLANQPL